MFQSVPAISYEVLKKNGVEGILLDIDNTLIDYTKVLSPQVIEWVKGAKQQGFQVCILSNSNKMQKIIPLAEALEIPYISFAKKPAKSGYLRAAQLLQLPIPKVAMVGDQVFTDVLGANRVGMVSIYVDPINKKEYWYTKWKRPIEAWLLAYLQKKTERKEVAK